MKILHMISGGDKGGAKTAVFALLDALNDCADVAVACFTEGVFYREVQDLPVESVLFKQKHRNDFRIIRPLVKYIRTRGFDILHAHGARANFVAMVLKWFVKIPVITTVHSDYKLDFTDNAYKRAFYTMLNALALRRMNYYIGVSQNLSRLLAERKFDTRRIFTIHNAIDFDRERVLTDKAAFLGDFYDPALQYVGIVGRFVHVKGHDVFLRAAAEVAKVRDDARFLLAGDGEEEAHLKALAAELGLADKVRFTGFLDDIFSFLNAVDVNVCTSRTEGFPLMLLEGAVLKKPTVSTAVGGIPELITDAEHGILVPDGDVAGLAAGIIRYLDAPALAARHGENLHDYARARFSLDSLRDHSMAIYETVLSTEKAAGRRFDMMLSGYYGYGNSGDDAILEAVIGALRRERGDLALLVLSRRPAEAAALYGVYAVTRLNFFRIRRYMRRTRVIVYGGGSLMQDITSTKSLLYYTFLMHMAKNLGMRVMVYGNGIGPIVKPRNVDRARRALERCDYLSVRDLQSLRDLQRLGVTNPNVVVSVDPVFSLPAAAPAEDDAPVIPPPSRKYFIVSLRPWPHNAPHFIRTMARVIDRTADLYGLRPLFVPMHKMDLEIITETAGLLSCPCETLSKVYEARDLMTLIAGAEFVMGMRLHTLIYAVRVGRPVIGLSYDPKVSGFVEYLGESTFVHTADADAERLNAMVDILAADTEGAAARIAAAYENLKTLAGEDARAAVGLLG